MPERIPYVRKEELPEQDRELIESHTVRPGEPLHIRQCLANNLPLFRSQHEHGLTIRRENGLSTRNREIVILTVARQLRSDYIWQQHITFALGEILSEEDVRALFNEKADSLGDDVVALVEYTAAFAEMAVTDEIHDALSEHYSDESIVGIGLLVMNYVALAHGVDAFGVEIEHDEFVGWDLENA